jgi:hypothetical protein
MRTQFVVVIFALLASTGCSTSPVAPASAPAAQSQEIVAEIVDLGVYETLGETIDTPAPNTAAGKVGEHGGLNLLRAATSLKAERGISFGYRYRLRANYEGEVSGFEMHVIHPSMRGVDGKLHTSTTAPTELFFDGGVADGDIIYILSEQFEVLPGAWTLQIRYKGTVVISKTFQLS